MRRTHDEAPTVPAWGFPDDELAELPADVTWQTVDTLPQPAPVLVHLEGVDSFRQAVAAVGEQKAREQQAILYLPSPAEPSPDDAWELFLDVVDGGDWDRLREVTHCPERFRVLAAIVDIVPLGPITPATLEIEGIDAQVREHLPTCANCTRTALFQLEQQRQLADLERESGFEGAPVVAPAKEWLTLDLPSAPVVVRVEPQGSAPPRRRAAEHDLVRAALEWIMAAFQPLFFPEVFGNRHLAYVTIGRDRSTPQSGQESPPDIPQSLVDGKVVLLTQLGGDTDRQMIVSYSPDPPALVLTGLLGEMDRPITKVRARLLRGPHPLWEASVSEGTFAIPLEVLERALLDPAAVRLVLCEEER